MLIHGVRDQKTFGNHVNTKAGSWKETSVTRDTQKWFPFKIQVIKLENRESWDQVGPRITVLVRTRQTLSNYLSL